MTAEAPVVLRMRGVRKHFGATAALDGVDLEVRRGEVHALLGENGAGKSTLMKILAGAHTPDEGSMELDGRAYAPRGTQEAARLGVAMVYQELNLAPDLTVEDNVMLGRERGSVGFVRRSDARPRIREALALLGRSEIDPRERVAALAPAARQVVEIARALVFEARVVILDEPTSSLTREDAERLFAAVDRLRQSGVAVVYISHFLEEVVRVAQRYTVLRDGRSVGGGATDGTPISSMVEQMAGRKLEEFFPKTPHQAGEVVLDVRGLAGVRMPREATLALRRGEIFGIAGLVGAGRTELLRSLFGLDGVRKGDVQIRGETARASSSRDRLAQGMGLVPEDRKHEGLALALSIAVNTTLSNLKPLASWGFVSSSRQEGATRRWIERLGIRCRGPEQVVGELSGGNQQKVAIARLLHHDASILLFDEPTRGIDVGAKVEIYKALGELAAAGKSILVVSSYLPELFGICDRLAVMHRGVLGAARPIAEWTELEVLDEAIRGDGARRAAAGEEARP